MSAILDLPLSISIDFIKHAIKQNKKEVAWSLWTSIYPFMKKGELESIDFDDFEKELFKAPIQYTEKTTKEIEDEMMNVIAYYEGR